MLWLALILLAIAAICDLRTREIPDWISSLLALCGVAAAAFGWSEVTWPGLVAGLAVGLTLALPGYVVGGFGGGDVKLATALGVALGPIPLLWTFCWMAIAGGVLAVAAMCRGKREIAYAPAIALGLFAYILQSEALAHVASK